MRFWVDWLFSGHVTMKPSLMISLFLGMLMLGTSEASYFWQISDIHVDTNYSTTGNTTHFCHDSATTGSNTASRRRPTLDVNGSNDNGRYGNFSCDPPWLLLTSALEAMKTFGPDPDFILWTGDSMPHVNESEVTWAEVYENLNRITTSLERTFPGKMLIPVVGNHDVHPANAFPATGFKEVYQNFLSKGGWDNHVPPEEVANFKKGGYYARYVNPNSKILVLNTNVYLTYNSERSNETDPGGQLVWLKKELKLAVDKGTVVIIAAHVPPGFFERSAVVPFLASPYNEQLIEILVNYSSVIIAQMYGHTHTDSFRLMSGPDEIVKSHAFIVPSVSPWKVPLTGMSGINPAVRLYQTSVTQNGRITIDDYDQYFLNLTNANTVEPQNGTLWQHLYTATKTYNIENLNLTSIGKMYMNIATKPAMFDKYYEMNTAGQSSEVTCDASCKKMHLCAFRYLTETALIKCLAKQKSPDTELPSKTSSAKPSITSSAPTEDDSEHHHHGHHRHRDPPPYMKHVILGVSLTLLMALVVVAIVCMRRFHYRRRGTFPYTRQYSNSDA